MSAIAAFQTMLTFIAEGTLQVCYYLAYYLLNAAACIHSTAQIECSAAMYMLYFYRLSCNTLITDIMPTTYHSTTYFLSLQSELDFRSSALGPRRLVPNYHGSTAGAATAGMYCLCYIRILCLMCI